MMMIVGIIEYVGIEERILFVAKSVFIYLLLYCCMLITDIICLCSRKLIQTGQSKLEAFHKEPMG